MNEWKVAASALVLTIALAGCEPRDAQPAIDEQAPAVTVIHPERKDLTRTIAMPGDVVGLTEAALYAKATGYLERIDVDKGDWVKKGQLLAVIEVPELQQKLKRAQANLEVERVTYERLRSVWSSDKRLVAREDVDVARGKYAQAEADVEELAALVGYTRIVAPFDGVVTARYVDPGALIEAQGSAASAQDGSSHGGKMPVLALADISTVRVYVYVPEQETSLVKQGDPAKLTLREFPGREFSGSVTRFAHALDLATRTMLAEVDIPNPEHVLYPGMYAEVTLELEQRPGALVLPASAVGSDKKTSFALVVRDGELKKVAVTVGLADGGDVEITAGLAPDDDVVGHPSVRVTAGEKVRAVAAEAAPAAAAG
jgi:membrane fusion protein (multidrug efflux system)